MPAASLDIRKIRTATGSLTKITTAVRNFNISGTTNLKKISTTAAKNSTTGGTANLTKTGTTTGGDSNASSR